MRCSATTRLKSESSLRPLLKQSFAKLYNEFWKQWGCFLSFSWERELNKHLPRMIECLEIPSTASLKELNNWLVPVFVSDKTKTRFGLNRSQNKSLRIGERSVMPSKHPSWSIKPWMQLNSAGLTRLLNMAFNSNIHSQLTQTLNALKSRRSWSNSFIRKTPKFPHKISIYS